MRGAGAASLAETLRGRRVGVALSSAFFGFFGHAGFLRALGAAGVEPALLGGTSAGAMAAAFAGAGGLEPFIEVIAGLRRADFWDPAVPTARPPGLLKGARLRGLLERHLPVRRFEDCVTPVLTVSTSLRRRARHVDTTGDLALAVHASSALPLLFAPVRRADGDLHLDGGLFDKAPIAAMLDHRPDLEALVVHLIPSSGMDRRVAGTPFTFVEQALDWVRDDGWRLQADLATARGVPVYVVTTHPPRPNPLRLDRGPQAVAVSEAQTRAALAASAQAWPAGA